MERRQGGPGRGLGLTALIGTTPPSAPTQSSNITAQKLELSTEVRLPPAAAFETFVSQRPLWRRALVRAATLDEYEKNPNSDAAIEPLWP